MTTPLNGAGRYTIPGLDGVWQVSGLETTNMGSNGRATIHMRRDTATEPTDPIGTEARIVALEQTVAELTARLEGVINHHDLYDGS